jgi:hypothetical protein
LMLGYSYVSVISKPFTRRQTETVTLQCTE